MRAGGEGNSGSAGGSGEEQFAHVGFIDTLIANEAISPNSLARELVRHLEELTITITSKGTNDV